MFSWFKKKEKNIPEPSFDFPFQKIEPTKEKYKNKIYTEIWKNSDRSQGFPVFILYNEFLKGLLHENSFAGEADIEAYFRQREAEEKELLAEAARRAVLDTEKREADRRAEEERDRLETERRAEEERAAVEKARAEEAARIEAEMLAAREAAKEQEEKPAAPTPKAVYLTKTVNLIFRRTAVDKTVVNKVRAAIVAAIKLLGKENVYMKIKAATPDQNTLTLTFSELPVAEEKLIVDLIQILGKSGLGITKATLE